jgi:glycopeptide antibiotics resistance protein
MDGSKNKENSAFRAIFWFVLVMYLLVLTKMVLFKQSPHFIKDHLLNLTHRHTWQAIKANARHANFTPFATISLYLKSQLGREYAVQNIGGNIAGFIPFGVLLPLLFVGVRRSWKVILLTFMLSLIFETTQLITGLGVFDVDDLMLNTFGGLLGYSIFVVFFRNMFVPRLAGIKY